MAITDPKELERIRKEANALAGAASATFAGGVGAAGGAGNAGLVIQLAI